MEMERLTFNLEQDGRVSVSGEPRISTTRSSDTGITDATDELLVEAMNRAAEAADPADYLTAFAQNLKTTCADWLKRTQETDETEGRRPTVALINTQTWEGGSVSRGKLALIDTLRTFQLPLFEAMAADDAITEGLKDAAQTISKMRDYHPVAEGLYRPLLWTTLAKTQLLQSATFAAGSDINDFVLNLYDTLGAEASTAGPFKLLATAMKTQAEALKSQDLTVTNVLSEAASGASGQVELHQKAQEKSVAELMSAWRKLEGTAGSSSADPDTTASELLQILCAPRASVDSSASE